MSRDALLQTIYHLVRIGCGVIFLYASWEKLLDPAGFARMIGNYQLLPPALVHPAAVVLPWVEAVCGLSLVTGVRAGGGLAVFSALMALFTAALALNALRGVDVECGCFTVAAGAGSGRVLEALVRDVVILAAALWALRHRVRREAAGRAG
jgi:putative oxidoreductase